METKRNMDTDNLQQEIEIPNRWLEAIVNGLASKVANETPSVDVNIVPLLEQRAAVSMQRAWDGDGDGSPTQINPGIRTLYKMSIYLDPTGQPTYGIGICARCSLKFFFS